MPKSYKLSLNHNDMNTLSRKLEESSINFKDLSREIKSIYNKLDWQTASKENVYEHVRKASESALRIYALLNNASKTINRISKDFAGADRDAASLVSKEASDIRRLIRSSGIKTGSSNAFRDFINGISNLFFGDDRYGTIPIAPVPKSVKYFAANDSGGLKIEFGFDWPKTGLNPFNYKDAESNIINFYLNSAILATLTIIIRYAFSNTYKFSELGTSIVRFMDSGDVYYLITGKESALRDLDVTLPTTKRYGMAQGQGVSNQLMRKVRLGTDQLKSGLQAANRKYRLKLRAFKQANPGLLQNNNLLLKQIKYRFTADTLKELEGTLATLEKAFVQARLKVIKMAQGNSRLILRDLNRNFKVQAVLKNIDLSLWNNLPRIDTLKSSVALKLSFEAAVPQLLQDLKRYNLWHMTKQIISEGKSITQAGGFLKGVSKFCKSSAILTAIGIGIDIFFDVIDDQKRTEEKIAAVFVDIAFGIATAAASAFLPSLALGAFFGTFIPIPIVGTIIGAAIGAAIGLAIVIATEVITINGISLKRLAKNLATAAIDIGKDIGPIISDAYHDTTEAVSAFWDDTTHFISSGWNSLFGGGNKSEKSYIAAPTKEAYDNQTMDLKPSNYPLVPSTTINLGSSFQYRFANN